MDVIIQSPWITPEPLAKQPCEKNPHLETLASEVAASELRENGHTREECLRQLREWIRQNPDIENCITGRTTTNSETRIWSICNVNER